MAPVFFVGKKDGAGLQVFEQVDDKK